MQPFGRHGQIKVQSSASHLHTLACLMYLGSKRGVTRQLLIDRRRVFCTVSRKQSSRLSLYRIPFHLCDLVGAKVRVRKFSKGHDLVELPTMNTPRLSIAGFHCSQHTARGLETRILMIRQYLRFSRLSSRRCCTFAANYTISREILARCRPHMCCRASCQDIYAFFVP